jgi:hypothetical protein
MMKTDGLTLDEIYNLGAVGLCKTFRLESCTIREFCKGGIRTYNSNIARVYSLDEYRQSTCGVYSSTWRVVS